MRVGHLTDSEIQAYLDDFQGHGRVSVDSLDPEVQEHLDGCSRCQKAVREYAHLYTEMATQPVPSLAPSFAYRMLALLPRRNPVPPVVFVPVTLGWIYLALVGVFYAAANISWTGVVWWTLSTGAGLVGWGQKIGLSLVMTVSEYDLASPWAYLTGLFTLPSSARVSELIATLSSTSFLIPVAVAAVLLVAVAESLELYPTLSRRGRRR